MTTKEIPDTSPRGLYRFNLDCGRMGGLGGLFTATADEVAASLGKQAYFGEVLGEHSEIYTNLEAGHFTHVSEADASFVALFDKLRLGSGFNPLHYIDGDEESEEED